MVHQVSQAGSGPHYGPSLFQRLIQRANRPLIIAHRGYRACFPENTHCAFDQSLGRCDMIELDVQLSRDGVPVVFHDHTLDRTSDAKTAVVHEPSGSLQLGDWTLAQLRQLDVGTWFLAADPFRTLCQNRTRVEQLRPLLPQRIMTLAEVLTWARRNDMPLNVELKDQPLAATGEQMTAEVIRILRAAKSQLEVVLSSFNHNLLRLCHRLVPEIATAALQADSHPPDLSAYLQDLAVCAYHPADAITDAALVSNLRSKGFEVNVFTVNDPARQQALFSWGVSGIFTDFPRLPPGAEQEP